MAEHITIPQQDIVLRETKQGKPVTCFAAMHNGKLLQPVEAWGDRKAQILEAMHNGKALEVDKLEFNEQWKRWSVWFPRGSGAEAGYRSKFGTRAGSWGPQGYRGQPVSLERWQATTGEVFASAVAVICEATATLPGAVADLGVILSEARSLVATYWMAVEHNVTFPRDCEPKPDSVPTSAPANATSTSNGGAKLDAAAQDVYVEALALAVNEAEVRGLMDSVRKTITDKVRQAELLTACLARLRVLAAAQREPGDL